MGGFSLLSSSMTLQGIFVDTQILPSKTACTARSWTECMFTPNVGPAAGCKDWQYCSAVDDPFSANYSCACQNMLSSSSITSSATSSSLCPPGIPPCPTAYCISAGAACGAPCCGTTGPKPNVHCCGGGFCEFRTMTCQTTTPTCESGTAPTCGGTCPAGQTCQTKGGSCLCMYSEPSCKKAKYPACGGTCPSGQTCQIINKSCSCGAPPPPTCTSKEAPACDGTCAPGTGTCQSTGTSCICSETPLPSCGDGACTEAEGCGCLVDCFGKPCGPFGKTCDSDGFCSCKDSSEVVFCTDAIDNDCDGKTDCNDPDCEKNLVCMSAKETMCADLIDNDSDGWIDCKDPDCPVGTLCRLSNGDVGFCEGHPKVTIPRCCTPNESGVGSKNQCGNTQDDDCDGQTDCADSDCIGSTACCSTPGTACVIASDCCGGLVCSGPRFPKTCQHPPAISPSVPPTRAPTSAPSVPALAPALPAVPGTPTVPTAPALMPTGIPSYCSSPAGCHLGFSQGVCTYLPNNAPGEASTCASPGQLRSPTPRMPSIVPAIAPAVPSVPPAFIAPACPYTIGCHTECFLGRMRLRPGSTDDAVDMASVGSGCESPPDALRPSLVRRLTTGIRSLLLRRR